jgi:hypothetical protein
MNRLEPTARTVTVVTAPPEPDPRWSRVPVGFFVALVLFGGGLRTVALASDRNLWIDEAMLALNIVNRTPAQLFKPLDLNQGAPVGFLLAVKGSISAFGASEWALRLVPFLASLVGLVGFAWLARRLLPPYAALLAVGLFALSPHMISYAAECKQYGCDASIAIGLFALALALLEGKGGLGRWLALAAAGAVAVWCSHPATFVLGGIGTALLARAAIARDRRTFITAALTSACWLVSFGACYVLCLRDLGGNKYLTDYWADHFMPMPPTHLGDLAWIADHLIGFFGMPAGFGGTYVPLAGFAAVLALIGLRELGRERWPVAAALVLPVGFLLFASGLHKYPFGGRLVLFLTPFAVLLVARGAWALFEAAYEKNQFVALAMLGLLLFSAGWQTQDELRRPMRYEQLNPLLEQLRGEIRPDDPVYVYHSAVPAFSFYTRTRALPAGSVTLGNEHPDDTPAYYAELAKFHGRVWVIYSHPHNHDQTALHTMLDGRGKCQRTITMKGAVAWLYVFD